MHALGFFHEQSRPDRDQFVDIFPQNMRSGKLNTMCSFWINKQLSRYLGIVLLVNNCRVIYKCLVDV